MSNTIKQHFVPVFLLYNFADKSSGEKREAKIKVFNKSKNLSWVATTGSIAIEKYLYDVTVDVTQIKRDKETTIRFCEKYGEYDKDKNAIKISIEKFLSELEHKASIVIAKILTEDSLESLSDCDRSVLAKFVSVQWLRVPANREFVEKRYNINTFRNLKNRFYRKYLNSRAGKKVLDSLLWIQSIVEMPRITQNIFDMNWILFSVPAFGRSLVISDNPIIIENPYYDSYGILTDGTKILIPLSGTRLLVMINEDIDGYGIKYMTNNEVIKFNAMQLKQAKQFVFG